MIGIAQRSHHRKMLGPAGDGSHGCMGAWTGCMFSARREERNLDIRAEHERRSGATGGEVWRSAKLTPQLRSWGGRGRRVLQRICRCIVRDECSHLSLPRFFVLHAWFCAAHPAMRAVPLLSWTRSSIQNVDLRAAGNV